MAETLVIARGELLRTSEAVFQQSEIESVSADLGATPNFSVVPAVCLVVRAANGRNAFLTGAREEDWRWVATHIRRTMNVSRGKTPSLEQLKKHAIPTPPSIQN